MAEIKRTFQAGKMNKDLDERIVPQGEYRDALNIEIRTSDSSDVGAVQNLYANVERFGRQHEVNPTISWWDERSSFVGSIADNKTNNAYFFVASPSLYRVPKRPSSTTSSYISKITSTKVYKDMILKYSNVTKEITPVVIDIFGVEFPKASFSNDTGHATTPYDYITLVDDTAFNYVRVGMTLTILKSNGSKILLNPEPFHFNSSESDIQNIKIIKTDSSNKRIYFDKTVVGLLSDAVVYRLEAEPVLKFSYLLDDSDAGITEMVTGINIINNLLFWTDNNSEPKKINIDRCIIGSNPTGSGFNTHTSLVTEENKVLIVGGPLKEEHITVIRRAPRTALNLDMSSDESGKSKLTEALLTMNSDHPIIEPESGTLLSTGDHINVNIEPSLFSEGQFVTVTCSTEVGDPVSFTALVQNFNSPNEYRLELVSVDTNINENHANSGSWVASIDQRKPLFELKIGRFSYRYKYTDGEYSSFAPWSELAFLPGPFDYIPKKGYNLGMVNNLRYLKIKDFIVEEDQRPDDVVEVDILYKDTVSPNCYVVKSIVKGKDPEWKYQGTGNNKGALLITSEMIHRTLPSSQILRAWDNVPRVARAQEVTGNRILYGNYLQNYDFRDTMFVRQSLVSTEHPSDEGEYLPYKSIKSIRDYKIGVVFGDKYGRETPVLGFSGANKVSGGKLDVDSNASGINVDKDKAANINQLSARIDLDEMPPRWVEYYKFYVKETSNEYYNLAMDRWYNAEDGNIWLSFQSADRNKVDIETYLILKNGHGNNEPVIDDARYKILAIKNEAPDFIKTTHRILGASNITEDDGNTFSGIHETMVINLSEDAYNNMFGEAAQSVISANANGIKWARLRAIKTSTEEVKYSQWVKIASVNSVNESFTTIEPFGMNFIEAFGTTPDSYQVEVRISTSENRPEFDGRFFVKVYKDAVLSRNVLLTTKDGMVYNSINNLKVFFISPDAKNPANPSAAFQGDYTNIQPDTNTNEMQAAATNNFTGDPWGWDYSEASGDAGWAYAFPGDSQVWELRYFNCNDGAIKRIKQWWDAYRVHRQNSTNYRATWFLDSAPTISTMDYNGDRYNGDYNSQAFSETSGVSGFSKMRFSRVNKTGDTSYSDDTNEFYSALEPGALFRFPADPFKVVYQIKDRTGISNSFQYNTHEKTDSPFDNSANCRRGDGGHSFAMRTSFNVTFNVYNDPYNSIDTTVWDPRSAVRHDVRDRNNGNAASSNTELGIEILQEHFDLAESIETAQGNAIWETEPREDVGMDLYYEATDAIPMYLKETNNESFAPAGSDVTVFSMGVHDNYLSIHSVVENINNPHPGMDEANTPIVHSIYRDVVAIRGQYSSAAYPFKIRVKDILKFHHKNGMITEGVVRDHWVALDSATDSYTKSKTFTYNIEITSDGDGKILTSSIDAANFTASDDESETWEVTSTSWDSRHRIFVGKIEARSDGYTYIKFSKTSPTVSLENLSTMDLESWDNMNLNPGTYSMTFKEITGYFRLEHETWKSKVTLPWFNCYSFGNGLESDRIRDDFNAPTIDNGVKVSTGLDTYGQERRESGMIYSGIYNSTSGVNRLNEFNMAESITKDLNPMYGSIQAIKTRDTNVVVFCEDKVFKVLANKNALYNANGSSNVAASNTVLGDAIGMVGDYGISKNPESLVMDNFRMYFTDRQRGKVLRLSQDGLTPISDVGMKSFFRDEFKPSKGAINLIGSFDTIKGEYNLSMKHSDDYIASVNNGKIQDVTVGDITISYSEASKGWPSFKSFIPETGLSINEEYLTGKDARLWSHHNEFLVSEGPNLIANGTFESDEGWTIGSGSTQTISNTNYIGALRMTSGYDGAVPQNALSKVNAVGRVNKRYKLTHEAYAFAGTNSGYIRLDGVYDADNIISFTEGTAGTSASVTFTAYQDFSYIQYFCDGVDDAMTIDNVSLVEVFDEPIKLANNFYGVQYDSTIDIMFNDMPSSVKSFNTINYEGTQAKITSNLTDDEYYNLSDKDGWYVSSFTTDLQESEVAEFIDKENKWFNNVTGVATTLSNLDTSEFSVQGIGVASSITPATVSKLKLTIREID